jgi:hypothetical protein
VTVAVTGRLYMEQLIRTAIADKQLLEFTYHGLRRVAEPHVYGTVRGKYQLLTYQVGGQSSSGDLPNWRRVDVSGVSDLRLLEERFPGPRPSPSERQSRFDTVLAMVE